MLTVNKAVNIDLYKPRRTRTPIYAVIIMLAFGFNAAIGTNLSLEWYYVNPAISWLDIIVFINFLFLLRWENGSVRFMVDKEEKVLTYFILAFSFLLLISTLINSFRFTSNLSGLLPPIKLIYFISLIHVIRKYTERYGMNVLINGFFLGATTFFLQSYSESQVLTKALPVLWNPNVTGALIALGIFFGAMLMYFEKKLFTPLFFSIIFLIGAAMTWSKGAWLMSLLGCFLMIIVLIAYLKLYKKNLIYKILLIFLFLAFLTYISVINFESLMSLFQQKMKSTEYIGSVNVRLNLIFSSILTGVQNPFFGLGYRNFHEVVNYNLGLDLGVTNTLLNAHNAFFQILAVAGIPAFIILIWIFIYPFRLLQRSLLAINYKKTSIILMVLLSFSIWFTYGSIQLQLLAQPPFWFFCGLMLGVYKLISSFKR